MWRFTCLEVQTIAFLSQTCWIFLPKWQHAPRSAKCADASQILWGYGGYTSLTMVVNGRNEEGGGGHQSNRELANTEQDQTTQLLFPTKTCSPTVPSEFRFSPALAHSFLYNPVQISRPSRFDEVSVSSTDSTKPNQIGQAVDLGTGYQERETTLEKSNPYNVVVPRQSKDQKHFERLRRFHRTRSAATRRRATLPNFKESFIDQFLLTDDGVDAETSLSLSLHLYLSSPPLQFILTLTFGQ